MQDVQNDGSRLRGTITETAGEWAISQEDLPKRSEQAVAGTARKAWRFVGEMEEIAVAFAAAGVPGRFHEAGAEVHRRLAG